MKYLLIIILISIVKLNTIEEVVIKEEYKYPLEVYKSNFDDNYYILWNLYLGYKEKDVLFQSKKFISVFDDIDDNKIFILSKELSSENGINCFEENEKKDDNSCVYIKESKKYSYKSIKFNYYDAEMEINIINYGEDSYNSEKIKFYYIYKFENKDKKFEKNLILFNKKLSYFNTLLDNYKFAPKPYSNSVNLGFKFKFDKEVNINNFDSKFNNSIYTHDLSNVKINIDKRSLIYFIENNIEKDKNNDFFIFKTKYEDNNDAENEVETNIKRLDTKIDFTTKYLFLYKPNKEFNIKDKFLKKICKNIKECSKLKDLKKNWKKQSIFLTYRNIDTNGIESILYINYSSERVIFFDENNNIQYNIIELENDSKLDLKIGLLGLNDDCIVLNIEGKEKYNKKMGYFKKNYSNRSKIVLSVFLGFLTILVILYIFLTKFLNKRKPGDHTVQFLDEFTDEEQLRIEERKKKLEEINKKENSEEEIIEDKN